ncbi:MAG: DnaJ domain-containing protein [Candidatus Coatesbacteria bacterium]|nr:DnaJ domain-containing protein [Candidatus Coatesbacteria bacterium]
MEKIKDYYKILGIEPTASQEEIKKRYMDLAKQYHPDKQPTEEERNQLIYDFNEVTESYNCLKDPAKREVYDADKKLWEKIQSLSDSDLARVFQRKAKQSLEEAETMETKNDDSKEKRKLLIRSAIRFLEFSTEKHNMNPMYWCDLGLAYLADGNRPKAKEMIQKAISIEEFHPEFHFALAKVYIDGKAISFAKKSLFDALKWDNTFEPARKLLNDLGETDKKNAWDIVAKAFNSLFSANKPKSS